MAHPCTKLLALAMLPVLLSQVPSKERRLRLPADVAKILPAEDRHPPVLHSDAYLAPVPVPGAVNTSGAEDSPYISEDGRTLWFWFTPDVRVPPEKQILDGVTGIYEAKLEAKGWTEGVRVLLSRPHELALDGAQCVQGDTMWFASARQGNGRPLDIWIARRRAGRWTDWVNAGERWNKDFAMGELHVTPDGKQVYFHTDRPGGKGKLDIWCSELQHRQWGDPKPVSEVNSQEDDTQPFVTYDGRELWFTRTYRGTPAVYRSTRKGKGWSSPELILSQFAGEPSVDRRGNVYFVHHLFRDGRMIEADIYVARRK